MSLLVVGSVALDSVKTPFGEATDVLGGSATFFSVAASYFTSVNVVATVGEDFPPEHLDFLRSRGVDVAGVETGHGKTFRWRGEYSYQLNEAKTLETQLNVFERFAPRVPEAYRSPSLVFLANIDPTLQRDVLSQVRRPKIVACDTMNFWIAGKKPELERTLKEVDILIINDGEARQLAGEANLVKASRAIMGLGPQTVIIKRGEYGALLFSGSGVFAAPAFPLEHVFDPTGAGDSFAGGFLGHLAKHPSLDRANLCKAVIFGSVLASFCVEAFSLDRFKTLTRLDIQHRYRDFKHLTFFEDVDG
ncbi:MAG: sugar kinase [Nitrospirae bacterium]|nr:sugar kinase [Nitrospirota bacterium]